MSTPFTGLPCEVVSSTVTVGVNCCGLALRVVFCGGTVKLTTEVNDTGPISLSPLTRPVPPPLRVANIAAYAGCGASQLAAFDRKAKPPNPAFSVDDVGQKLSGASGGRITGESPWWACSTRAVGSVMVHTPTRMFPVSAFVGSVLRSNRTPACGSLARLETVSFSAYSSALLESGQLPEGGSAP
jgi:hypothetical protein